MGFQPIFSVAITLNGLEDRWDYRSINTIYQRTLKQKSPTFFEIGELLFLLYV
jgi:hypothetical protein